MYTLILTRLSIKAWMSRKEYSNEETEGRANEHTSRPKNVDERDTGSVCHIGGYCRRAQFLGCLWGFALPQQPLVRHTYGFVRFGESPSVCRHSCSTGNNIL